MTELVLVVLVVAGVVWLVRSPGGLVSIVAADPIFERSDRGLFMNVGDREVVRIAKVVSPTEVRVRRITGR